MMRVLQVTNNPRWEGMEAQIAALAAGFREHPHVTLHAALFHPGVLKNALVAVGVPVEVVPVRWQLDVGGVRQLARLLRTWRIDVLHSHGYKANVIGALAARWAGVPAIVRTEHGLPEPFRGHRRAKMAFYLWLDGLVGRHLTRAVIGVSADVAAHARQRFPRTTIACIRNGIDPSPPPRRSPEVARASLGLPYKGPVVGAIGRLVPVKGHRTFLQAAQRLGAALPTAHFILAGEGPLREALVAQVGALGLGDRFHFCYSPSGIQTILDSLDVLVFSSLHEGIPYTLLEALRAAVPVVATAVGGLAEVLVSGQDSLLVPAEDPVALAGAVLALLQDVALAARLRRKGLETLTERFSVARMCEQTAAVYEEALRVGHPIPAGLRKHTEAAAHGRSR